MELLRKYGVATTIRFPLIKAGSNNFAVAADFTHAAGDTKISKDGGAAVNTTNAPAAVAMGNAAMWQLTLTATEMQAASIMIAVSDAAAKAVEDQMIIIATYGNALAEHAFDLDTATQSVTVSGTKTTLDALNDLSAADVNAQVDVALDSAIPGVPTADSINERIKALDDAYTAARAGNLDNLDAAVSTRSTLASAQVNAEVVDALTVDTIAELAQAIPPATPTLTQAVMLLYMALRNKVDVTSTLKEIHNDAGTVIAKKTLSDDGTTYSEAEMVSGP